MPDDEAPDEDEQTRVTCPKCGGDTRQDCTLCEGHGSVTAAKAAFWRAGKLASGSGEHRIDLPPKK